MSLTAMTTDALLPKPQTARRNWHVGRLAPPTHAHPLVRFVFAELNRQAMSMNQLAELVGCNYYTIAKWRYQQNPQLQLLDAALTALGWRLAPVPVEAKK